MFCEVIGRNISIIYRQEQVFIDHLLKSYALNKVQAEILLFLESEKMTNLTQMNTHFLLNKASMSKNIKNLLNEEYLIQSKNNFDKRENLLSLSDKGVGILPTLKDVFQLWENLMIDQIKDQDLEQLRITLADIVDNIRTIKDKN